MEKGGGKGGGGGVGAGLGKVALHLVFGAVVGPTGYAHASKPGAAIRIQHHLE